MMTLGLDAGEEITLSANGDDEECGNGEHRKVFKQPVINLDRAVHSGESANEEYKGIQTERRANSRCIPFRFNSPTNMKEEDYLCQKY